MKKLCVVFIQCVLLPEMRGDSLENYPPYNTVKDRHLKQCQRGSAVEVVQTADSIDENK